ncbi:hypothetical protein CTI12_AA582470 [Artemisia annua]|uniref:DUF7950 domain-containing protein n=1 Tax=Artemisia annua TaxID=35608 RepID=A0A2U1KF40_ARTAN|nr:hypothetical protein CTI12_AA582470 [Artemisia annua]
MDNRGGCCITRYSDRGGYDMSKVDRIMLKFRPIAPKPIASVSGSSSSTVDNTEGGTKRRKRKYVRSSNGNKAKKNTKDNSPKKRKVTPSSSSVCKSGETTVRVASPVTLPLMPETPDRNKTSPGENIKNISCNKLQLDLCNSHVTRPDSGHVTVTNNKRNTESVSLVTMECVMDAWISPDVGLGFATDHTIMMNLEIDTCPSFVTNSRDMVVWTNKAYKEMTSGIGADVTVVNKYNKVSMPVYCSAFTCKIKVTWGSKLAPLHLTAPCDVWRLRSGGYAWRLDVKAALCLGR